MGQGVPFIPAQPPRVADWVPGWKAAFGKRLRNQIYGLPEPAFDELYRKNSIFGRPVHTVSDPDIVEHILLDDVAHFPRPALAAKVMEPVLGKGLLIAEGELWRQQRKIIAPSFTPGSVLKMIDGIVSATQHNIADWPKGEARIDMARVATDTTMQVIAGALFSADQRLTSEEAVLHIENVLKTVAQPRFSVLFGLMNYDPSPSMIRARRGAAYLRSTLAALVGERTRASQDDFLKGLVDALHAHFPNDEALALAIDNAITFYGAGHETTANALAWTIYLLAAQPKLQDDVRNEVLAKIDGEAASLADRLPLLRRVIDESLRLYPSFPILQRAPDRDMDVGGYRFRKGDYILISPWIIHRHRKLWDNPDAFDHTRFTPENKAKLHRFQYLPFGGGPRVCIGQKFALTEAVLILAHWLAKRRFSLPDGFQPKPVAAISLRPEGGIPLIVAQL